MPTPCACGCRQPALPRSKYADRERCRQRAYSQRVRAAAREAGLPDHLSLKTVETAGSTSPRQRDAQKPARSRPRRAPDLRVNAVKLSEGIIALEGGWLVDQALWAQGYEKAVEDVQTLVVGLLTPEQARELQRRLS